MLTKNDLYLRNGLADLVQIQAKSKAPFEMVWKSL